MIIDRLPRRLRIVFGLRQQVLAMDDPPPSPLREFIAYAADCQVSGLLSQEAGRLTDLLNANDEYELINVQLESLADGHTVASPVVLVARDELIAVHASGPVGSRAGIEPFGRLVEQVMTSEPYASARRVFWVLDHGSSHRGKAAVTRLTEADPRLVPVHLPVHASWLNQVAIYFSILERKVLTPAVAASLEELAARILAFQATYEVLAQPFEWKFTRADLTGLLERLALRRAEPLPEAA